MSRPKKKRTGNGFVDGVRFRSNTDVEEPVSQTSGVLPALYDRVKKTPKGKPKGKGKK